MTNSTAENGCVPLVSGTNDIKLKFFLEKDVHEAIAHIEKIFDKSSPKTRFAEVDKLRFMRPSALFAHILFVLTFRHSPYRSIFSLNAKKTVRTLWRLLFRPYFIHSSSDVIHIRNSLSLFFFSQRVRVKVLLKDGLRSKEEFRNEFAIRKDIEENSPQLKVPKLIGELIEGDVSYLQDEIVDGESYQWDDPRSAAILTLALEKIWPFYVFHGIEWKTPAELGIDIAEKMQCFKAQEAQSSEQFSPVELNRLVGFQKLRIPTAQIHGDLSVGNMLISGNNLFVIDWECSRRDLLIKEFRNVFTRRPEVVDVVDEYVNKEIAVTFKGRQELAMTLDDQLLLERFLCHVATN